jgi:hypothetical protein
VNEIETSTEDFVEQPIAPVEAPDEAAAAEAAETAEQLAAEVAEAAEQPAAEEPAMGITRDELMEGVPYFNLGALFMPPIWGPAHGIWPTIIFYPLWAIADSCLYAAYSNPSPLSVITALLLFAAGAAGTLVFAHTAQFHGLIRAYEQGHDKDWYLKRQRVWAIWMTVVAVILIIAATYYNLAIKPTLF